MTILEHLRRCVRKRHHAMIMASCLYYPSFAALASDIAIISHPGLVLKKTDPKIMRAIFLKKMTHDANNNSLIPVNLPTTHPVRSAFSKLLFSESPNASARYWNKQYFLGVSPPFVLNSQEAVLRFVNETPGGIGYALDCLIDDRVKVISHVQASLTLQRSLQRYCQ